MSEALAKLERLARLFGIQTSYVGLGNKRKSASPDALLRVLSALGASVNSVDDASKVLAEKKRQLKDEPQPVIVAWEGRLDPLTRRKLGGNSIPKQLPMGYHPIKNTLVISAPVKAYFPISKPAWGVFAPVYALHSTRKTGIGDLTDFGDLIDWMTLLGGRVAATLPLLANFLDTPFEPSPYSPASRLFWSELYIDPEQTPEFKRSHEAQRLWANRPPQSRLVDYRIAMAHKRSVLEALSKSFFSSRSARREVFDNFVRKNREVETYARFRAVTDKVGAGWSQWPAVLRRGRIRPEDYEASVWEYHIYVQWIVQEQLQSLSDRVKRKGDLLYLDLPLGLHSDAYDTWRHRDFFVNGISGGAPPDIVFTTGQNWSLPPMHPHRMREKQHRYTIDYIRNHLRFAGLLRIDHVMGLHRFFWIPEGMPTSEGVYVEYPAEELYAILSVESHRAKAGIVGENLGNVAPVVNQSMRRHNIHEMYVAQYRLSDNSKGAKLNRIPANAVASLNTHDMPPYHAFLDGLDIPDKVALGFIDKKAAKQEARLRGRMKKGLAEWLKTEAGTPEEIFQQSLRFLGRSKSKVVLVNAEDTWQEVSPQNIPATSSAERPNWRRRLRYSVERIQKDPKIETLLQDLDKTRTNVR